MRIREFTSMFHNAFLKCYDKYSRRERIYQDSWKTCNITYLEERLTHKIEEYKESKLILEEYRESKPTDILVDIVNFCLMIIERRSEEP